MTITARLSLTTACLLTVAAAAPLSLETSAQTERLEITAMAVNMSNIGGGGTTTVEIRVNRWSTPDERTHLISTMLEKGPDALLRELQKMKSCGRFAIPGLIGPDPHNLRVGYDLQYARETPLPDGGRQIVLLTDRYIGFEEARARPRTMDYPFTLIQIRSNKDGTGEGKMAVATMITFDKKTSQIELENYSSEPVRLQALKVTARK